MIRRGEEDIANYKANLEEWKENKEEQNGRTVDKEWEELKNLVQEATVKKEVIIKESKLGYRRWWDGECTKKKRDLKKNYSRWRNGLEKKEKYA